jgi:tetratricopeptide (TPR) repeat protein
MSRRLAYSERASAGGGIRRFDMNRLTASAIALLASLATAASPAIANDDLVSPFGAKAKSAAASGSRASEDRTRGDLVSPFGSAAKESREARISGRDHLTKKILLRDRKIDRTVHRDHLLHKRAKDRVHHRSARYDRGKDRLSVHSRFKRYGHVGHRHASGCGCSHCVRTRTKIVIAPRLERSRTTTRTVIVRPTYDELYAGSPWDLLADWRFERALDRFGDLASNHQRRGEHKVGFALAALGLGERELAATAFRRALEIDPSAMTRFRAKGGLDRVVRDLAREIERLARRDAYDTNAVFLLASVRMLQTRIIDARDLEDDDYAMLRDSDRALLKGALPGAADPYRE